MTDAEAKFLLMCKMCIPDYFPSCPVEAARSLHGDDEAVKFFATVIAGKVLRESFPIVAQSFDQLCEERPELRPYFDAAKTAYERSNESQ
jgi:hypothetical protein